jgi:putative hydrolase of HD superfamily
VDPELALTFLQQSVLLKRIPRTGWLLRGVTDAESVADHSWGVALVALILLEGIDHPLDREKVLTIALLHDLPERVLSDIPSPAGRYFPPGVKRQAEEAVLAEMVAGLPTADRLLAWWREYEDGSSPEGRLVRDADRLDMLFQARHYEASGGARLEEFWETQRDQPFYYPLSQAIHRALCGGR